MSTVLRKPWTQDQFFAWADAQEGRYEFDGTAPVAMTGGNAGHAAIATNILTALRTKLRGTGCRPLGSDAGIETVNDAVRYPDALVTCSKFELQDRKIPGVVVVFEILSASTSRIDRLIKVREYGGVASIRRYVIVESTSVGLTVLERAEPGEAWRTAILAEGEVLRMPEIGIEVPVAHIYEDIAFPVGDVG